MNNIIQLTRRNYKRFLSLQMVAFILLASLPAEEVAAAAAEMTNQLKAAPAPRHPSLAELTRPIRRELRFTENPSDKEISNARVFGEPLVPINAQRIPAENQALAKALLAFKQKIDPENISDLVHFLDSHPASRWRPALEMNLGQRCFETGYLTDALTYWDSAWQATKNESSRELKSVADQAVSNLVLLEARLGKMDSLEKHLSEIGNRTLCGSASERVKNSRDGLWSMQHHPEISFKCGPFAVNTLANLQGKSVGCSVTIKKAASTSQGTNLAQLGDWAQQVGLKLQMALREPGAPILIPSVMHWKVGHFAAITAQENGKYRIQDPTFGTNSSFWISAKALQSQTDGYSLIQDGALPEGWRSVSRSEAESVWGKGNAQSQDATKTSACPEQPFVPDCNSSDGMAVPSAFSMNASLIISDTPLSYSPPVGPSMNVSLRYTYNEGMQPGTFTFTNLGPDWNLNWVSYLTVDASQNVTVRVPGGGYEIFNYPYTPNLTSQAQMINLGGGSYKRLLPDGSAQIFTLSDGTNTYMTSVTDPQGNAATISYDANYRATSITDASGNALTVAYASNTSGNAGFYKVATITDAFGRSASFGYDSTTTFLTSITDAAGNVSKFAYDTSSSFIDLLTTPYGSTSFYRYTPQGTYDYPPVGLRTTLPDGSITVIENWIGEAKSTYFWDREASARYPTDPANHNYTHCKTTRWLWESQNGAEAPVPNWVRPALEAPVVYTTQGEASQDFCGTSNQPTQIARQVTGASQTMTVGGTITAGNVLRIDVDDALLPAGDEPFFYTVQSGDTLTSVASGLAAAVNADTAFQAFGLTASSSSNVVTLTSRSTNSTRYFYFPNANTETLTFANAPNPPETAKLTGTVTAGDIVTITVHDSGLPGGQESVSYTAQSGDSLANEAVALAMATNSDTNLQSIGVTAVWSTAYFAGTGTQPTDFSPVIAFRSASANTTTYTSSVSTGATESISLAASTNGIVQAWNYDRNSLGYPTKSIDPLGRQFTYSYASNNIDLQEIRETTGGDNFLIAHFEYNNSSAPHRATLFVDGSGQKTQFTYNTSFAELATIIDANNNQTTLSYDTHGYPTQIDGPLSGSQDITTFAFYGYGLPHTITNSEGYVLTYSFDNLNRVTAVAFPDGTSEQIVYKNLDAVMHADRLGRWTQRSYNSLDQLVLEIDPLGRKTSYCWCTCGSLASLSDAQNHTTTWSHDLEGRVTQKTYPDQSAISYTYESMTGRLISQTDALNQTTSLVYNLDDTVMYKNYSNAINTTSAVATEYDTNFPRTTSVANGWGKVSYSYNPYANNLTNTAYIFIGGYPETPNATDTISVTFFNSALSGGQYTMPTYTVLSGDVGNTGAVATHLASTITGNATLSAAGISASATGALVTVSAGSTITVSPSATGSTTATVGGGGRLARVTNNVISNSPITFSYDALERTTARMINGGNNNAAWGYDAMSRVTSEADALGTFNYSYIDDVSGSSKGTLRLKSIGYPNGQTTNFGWYGTGLDERLQQITNLNSNSDALSQFNYAYNSAGEITKWVQQQAGNHANFNLTYDPAGQLASMQSGVGTTAPPFSNQFYFGYDCSGNRDAVQQSTIQSAKIGGTVTAGDTITIAVHDPVLTGGQESVSYIVQAGDTTSTIAAQLAAAICLDSNLQNAGVNATSSSSTLNLRSESLNLTTYTASVSGTAPTETVTVGNNKNIENVTVGGTVHAGDTPTITVYDPALVGGSKSDSYTVLSTDTLSSIASGLTSVINGDATLTAIGITASSANQVVAVQSFSPNVTAYATSVGGAGATVTLTSGLSLNGSQNALIGGTKTTGDVLSIIVTDVGMTGGSETVSYTVGASDTLATIASGLASAINNDTNLKGAGVTATASSTKLTVTSVSTNVTSYSFARSNGATETILWSLPANGIQTAAVGGSKTTGDVLTITIFDTGLTGGSKSDSYTVQASDTLNSIATGLASAINADSSLNAIGVTATAVSSVVNITSASNNATTYAQSVSAGATETITLAPSLGVQQAAFNSLNELISISGGGKVFFQGTTARPDTAAVVNINQTATIGGIITAGDTIFLSVHNAALSQAEVVSYVVQTGDTTTSIATALKNAINADSTLSTLGVTATASNAVVKLSSTSINPTFYTVAVSTGATETVTLGGSRSASATWASSQAFSGSPALAAGSNTASVTAVSGGGTAASNTFQLIVNGGSSSSLTYDSNGNCTSDGTNMYSWDAENRLVKITYTGANNYTTIVHDGLGRRVQIIETTSGSVTSTKNFVFCGLEPCEERDASYNLTKQFFAMGQKNGSTGLFYAKSHQDHITEVTNNSGAIVYQQTFDPYGRPIVLVTTTAPDFGYAGMYHHARSGLNLTMFRAYNPTLGRWLSRDPLGESMGSNRYTYVGNSPVNLTDALGLIPNSAEYNTFVDAGLAGVNESGIQRQSHASGHEYGFFVFYDPCSQKYGYTTPFSSKDKGVITGPEWLGHAGDLVINGKTYSSVAWTHTHPDLRPIGDNGIGYETFSPTDTVRIDRSGMPGFLSNQYGQIRFQEPYASHDIILQGPPTPGPSTTPFSGLNRLLRDAIHF